MDEIQFDDGRNVDKIGQRPTKDIDWEAIFKDATSGTGEPLSYATLAHIVSELYNIELESAEAYVYMASGHGELVRIDASQGKSRFYYFLTPDYVDEIPTNLIIPDLTSEFLTADSEVNLLSKDKLVERIDAASRRDLPSEFIWHVVEHIAHIDPFYVVNERVGSQEAVVCMQP
ncbi:hypothetical protein [Halorhabdus sp. CUG00001]|uniref:hypothetical protein n=1 Tax=Halorhabdus sp. CUG00001 TaxID=2600297 RepID=UPI00131CC1AA|nr:hypothetical protein [Halorhabdus sp. CUG00001]